MSIGKLFPSGSRLASSASDRDRDTYSATDIEAIIYGIDKSTGETIITKLGDIQTLTYSVHRDKIPVRTLGRINPKNYTAGTRTTAGTLIFATFNERALKSIYSGAEKIDLSITRQKGEESISDARIIAPSDSIPPFDIMLYFTNEAGHDSVMTIYQVEIADEGQTFSVQDVYSEHTMQYVAGGVSLLEKVEDKWKRSFISEQRIFNNAGLIRRATASGLDIG